jgi:hypothetical protein
MRAQFKNKHGRTVNFTAPIIQRTGKGEEPLKGPAVWIKLIKKGKHIGTLKLLGVMENIAYYFLMERLSN